METRTITEVKIHSLFIQESLMVWSTSLAKVQEYYRTLHNMVISKHSKAAQGSLDVKIQSEWINIKHIETYKVGLRIEE